MTDVHNKKYKELFVLAVILVGLLALCIVQPTQASCSVMGRGSCAFGCRWSTYALTCINCVGTWTTNACDGAYTPSGTAWCGQSYTGMTGVWCACKDAYNACGGRLAEVC